MGLDDSLVRPHPIHLIQGMADLAPDQGANQHAHSSACQGATAGTELCPQQTAQGSTGQTTCAFSFPPVRLRSTTGQGQCSDQNQQLDMVHVFFSVMCLL